jgi:hypothetical protein
MSPCVLSNSIAVQVVRGVVRSYEGQQMRDLEGTPFKSDVNGIALTKDNRYLYFKPINKLNLYRIETRYLADTRRDDKELASKVEDQGETTISHGLIADAQNNIYLTFSLDYSIKYQAPDGGGATYTGPGISSYMAGFSKPHNTKGLPIRIMIKMQRFILARCTR